MTNAAPLSHLSPPAGKNIVETHVDTVPLITGQTLKFSVGIDAQHRPFISFIIPAATEAQPPVQETIIYDRRPGMAVSTGVNRGRSVHISFEDAPTEISPLELEMMATVVRDRQDLITDQIAGLSNGWNVTQLDSMQNFLNSGFNTHIHLVSRGM